MSFSTETLCLHRVARMPFLSLSTAPHCQVTYIWVNNTGKLPKGKTRTLDYEPQSLSDVPHWFATWSVVGRTHEMELVPVRMYRDPFTMDPNKLVLCETRDLEGNPAPGQQRVECAKVMEAVKEQAPWFGFEQEFVFMGLDGVPLGWSSASTTSLTAVSTAVGLDKAYGRDVSLSHYKACLYAGVKIGGTVNEAIPAQWEYQIGPCGGTELGDHVWTSRYILHRVCEDFGLVASFHPKPVDHPSWCSGGHMNFSSEAMRNEGGLQHIQAAVERLALRHAEHMEVYGENNELRLNGAGLNSSFSKFTWRNGSRKGSVRIPGFVQREGRGFLEDRRPASNCDPYLVCKALAETCLLTPPTAGTEKEEETTTAPITL